MAYEIVEDSAECIAATEGEMTVAVVEVDEAGDMVAVDSCHMDMDAAQARLDALAAEEAGEAEVEDDAVTEMPMSALDGLDELERAAMLADRVQRTLGLLASLAERADKRGVVTKPEAAVTDEFVAIRSHSTATSDDEWDGPANETQVTSPSAEGYFADIYAWRDDEEDTSVKAAYRFIHHFVSESGEPGPASTVACSTGIGVLNGGRGGTTIPEADRQGVYNHLARHLSDANRDVPELMSQDAYEAALAEANLNLAAELETAVEDGGLAGIADEELIAELARRWAEDTVSKVATEEFGDIEVEIEVDKGGEDEAEGYHECEMCLGTGEITVNGITMECPCCGGSGMMEDGESEGEGEMMPPMAEPAMAAVEDAVEAAESIVFDWEGVLIVEGIPSGDGRMIAEQALTWRELPIPLMLQTVNAPGHDGAVIAGSIHDIVRDGQNIVGRGYFDSGEAGQEALRLLSEGTMRGVSADIDSVRVEFASPEGDEVNVEDMLFGGVDALEVLVEGRIMGATLTPFPAFQEAHVLVLDRGETDNDEVLVASGAEVVGDVWRVPSPIGAYLPGQGDPTGALESLVASAAASVEVPANPPREWFMPGDMDAPVPFTVHADGRVYGLVAEWGTCHIGFTDRCVPVPKSGAAYKHFRNKNVLTAEGDLVATGPIFMDTVHPNLRLQASDAQAFYADTGCAVADVALYENEFGIVAAGGLRPGLTPEQVRRFRGSDVSPDWRQINGRLEVVGLLSVNVSGFIVEGLVASGAEVSNPRGLWDSASGELESLVAAGMVRHVDTEVRDLHRELEAVKAELAEIREAIRPMRAERAAERFARLAQSFTKPEVEVHDLYEHGCGGTCGGSDGACACGS